MALQANLLSDLSWTEDGFEGKFEEMMSDLKPLFAIPNLSRNMRNCEKINRASQGVKENADRYKVRNTIEKLPPPTTTSSNDEPILIPVHGNDFESNFQNILCEAVFNPKEKTLILHSENFEGKDLKSLFLKNFPETESEDILQHDNHPNDATKEDLQDFLKTPVIKIGIFQSRFVTGIEGSNVIYFHDAKYDISSVRCAMTRAVSHLCIILRFRDGDLPHAFKRIKVNNKFIKCKKALDKYDKYFKCFSCNTDQICFACWIACHQEHEIEYEDNIKDVNVKCKCIKSNCFIQKD